MVKLTLGSTFEAAYEGLVGELKSNFEKNRLSRHIVLVPDKYSLTLEKSLLKALGIKGTATISVMSFTRFATISMKNRIKKCLTPEGSVMLLQKVINENRSKLSLYKNASYSSGFSSELYAALTALRNSGVSLENIKCALPEMSNSLKSKMTDIALLYECYLTELNQEHSDSSTRLEAFAEFIPDMDFIAAANIYITDFFVFTAPQYSIIESLMKYAASLTISLVKGEGENKRIYPQNTLYKLRTIAERQGLKIIEKHIPSRLKEPFSTIADNLYAYTVPERKDTEGRIKIYSTTDIFSEVAAIASTIKQLIIEQDYRFLDFGIVVGDIEQYTSVFHNVFKRMGISYFIDRKRSLTEQMPVRFLTSALDAAMSNKLSDVLEFVKNPFFQNNYISADDVDLFENYCLEHGIEYSDFRRPFEGSDSRTRSAEKVRKEYLRILPRFKKTATATEYLQTISEFFCNSSFYKKLNELYLHQEETGERFFSKCTSQIKNKLEDIFDEIQDTIGEEIFALMDFYRILSSMLSTVKIALAPLYIDSVFIGAAEDSRFENVKVLFIAGAVQGKMPAESGVSPIITAADEETLKQANIVVNPDKLEVNRAGLFYITQLLVRPTDRLFVSWPQNGTDGINYPSSIVGQLKELLSENGIPLGEQHFEVEKNADIGESDKDIARRAGYKFCSTENAYHELLGRVVSERIPLGRMQPYYAAFKLLPRDKQLEIDNYLNMPTEEKIKDADKLFFGKDRTSVSQLECYFSCPLKHFYKYGLTLEKRKDDNMQVTTTGSFIHAVLEIYFGKFVASEINSSISEAAVFDIVDNACEELIKREEFAFFAKSGRHKSSFLRLKNDCKKICRDLTYMLKNSCFAPYKLEARFGKGGEYAPLVLNVNGLEISLSGIIDRVDTYLDKFYIIDYKSGQKNLALSDIFYGDKIQLVVYLKAIAEQEKLTPVGMFYMPVTAGYRADADSRYSMKGLILNDAEVLQTMDKTVNIGVKSKYFNASLTKKGTVNSRERKLSAQDFLNICDYTTKLIVVAASEIIDGYIEASPADKACDKCDYADICRFNESVVYRKHIKTDLSAFCSEEKYETQMD